MLDEYSWLTDEVIAAEVADKFWDRYAGFGKWLTGAALRHETVFVGLTRALSDQKPVPRELLTARYESWKSRQDGAVVGRVPCDRCGHPDWEEAHICERPPSEPCPDRCETCQGTGVVDFTLGASAEAHQDPEGACPDCDGEPYEQPDCYPCSHPNSMHPHTCPDYEPRKQTLAEFFADDDRAHAQSLADRAARDAERKRREETWLEHVADDEIAYSAQFVALPQDIVKSFKPRGVRR